MHGGRGPIFVGGRSYDPQVTFDFAALHRPGDPLLLANAWDPASAAVIEAAGARALATTSSGVAWANGVPDGGRLGARALAAALTRIVAAVAIPVSADIEDGYGPAPADVAGTVRAVLDAGAVGINLEDCVHGRGAGVLVGVDDQCARMAAAREVADRRGVPLVINARTDTFLLGLGADVDERLAMTVERGARYLGCGADLVFVPLLVDPALVRRLADRLSGPLSLMALPGAPPAGELFSAGAARVSIGQMAMLAALGSVRQIADELRRHGTWRAIERTFFGFGEAEALFPARSAADLTRTRQEAVG